MLHYYSCPLCRGTLERVNHLVVKKDTYYEVKRLYQAFNKGLNGEMFEPLPNKKYVEVLIYRKKENNQREGILKKMIKENEMMVEKPKTS